MNYDAALPFEQKIRWSSIVVVVPFWGNSTNNNTNYSNICFQTAGNVLTLTLHGK